MVDGETDDHNMVPIAVYAAEGRIYVTVARGRDAIDSGSRAVSYTHLTLPTIYSV